MTSQLAAKHNFRIFFQFYLLFFFNLAYFLVLVYILNNINLLQHVPPRLIHKYSRMPEIETADLSQFHAGLNLPQFKADCLFHRDLNTTIKIN